MKVRISNTASILSCTLAGVLLAGCAAQQQQHGTYRAAAAVPPPAPEKAPEPAKPASGYGPSYTTFEENGMRWTRGSVAFPTGLRESSGLLIEKTVPAEVLAGQKFDYAYKVSNLADYTIHYGYAGRPKGEKVGNARVRSVRTSDGIPAPTTAEESTRVY